ncbi:MAG: PDZ domain-containing protein [bacterium]
MLRVRRLLTGVAAWLLLAGFASGSPAAGTVLRARVDATGLPRGLVKSMLEFNVSPGTCVLFYPRWVPGTHAPGGPIENLAEIAMRSPEGQPLSWRRDPHDPYRFLVEIPEKLDRLIVETTYIGNEASVNSEGADCLASSLAGVIAWNTCLVYPAGLEARDIAVDLSLLLPANWQCASSLGQRSADGGEIQLETPNLETLIDSPVIAGRFSRAYDITPPGGTPHVLHLVSGSERAVQLEEAAVDSFRNLAAEAMALFGTAHDYPYHFLVLLSDSLPFTGLEHLRSSLNIVGENGLRDEEALPLTGLLLAHEYAHRWCGKYHRPRGMIVPDFQTPLDTRLLWVYEGLDEYLGVVLAARAGLLTTKRQTALEGALQNGWMGIGNTLIELSYQKGRRTISLEDTGASSHFRRGGSRYWSALNRPQDYYFEGALLWFEMDCLLREKSGGKLSLDDFIRRFLGRYQPGVETAGYDENEITDRLNGLLPYDWKELIERRVRGLREDLPLDLLERAGYRLEYSNQPTPYEKSPFLASLGMAVDEEGVISRIVPGGPADRAQLREGARITGVNGHQFNRNRLTGAIAGSASGQAVELLMPRGEDFETVTLDYAGGLRHADLVRDESRPDRFAEIIAPRAGGDQAGQP